MANWIVEHKSICIGGGLGVLTALGQIFSETVKQHPHWAIASGVVATCMVVIPLLYPTKRDSSSGISNSNSGRDAIQAGGNVAIGDSAIELLIQKRDVQPIPSPNIPVSKPQLHIGPLTRMRIEHGHLDRFTDSPDGKIGVAVWVGNERTNGQHVADIGLSLTFKKGQEVICHINRTFWLGLTEFERDLITGSREQALVCTCHGNVLALYQNKRQHPLPHYRNWSQTKHLLESFRDCQPIVIPFDCPLEVEIAAIDSDGDTRGVARFLLTPIEGELMLQCERVP